GDAVALPHRHGDRHRAHADRRRRRLHPGGGQQRLDHARLRADGRAGRERRGPGAGQLVRRRRRRGLRRLRRLPRIGHVAARRRRGPRRPGPHGALHRGRGGGRPGAEDPFRVRAGRAVGAPRRGHGRREGADRDRGRGRDRPARPGPDRGRAPFAPREPPPDRRAGDLLGDDLVPLVARGAASGRCPPGARAHLRGVDGLGQVRVDEEHAEPAARSLLVLRALTHRRTGGIVAAPTTSLPEDFGGVRNWDYRFCWLRDAALSLEVLLTHGHVDAAAGWREWLLRAIAGDPERLQVMHSAAADRNQMERELEHLPGYEDSAPVRVGNGAAAQFQADVVGEVMIALAMMRDAGVEETRWSWPLQKALVRFTIDRLDEPDQGIWEMRGDPAFFTHGRVMVWAVFDRAIDAVRRHGLPARDGEVENWERLRDQMREEVLTRGVGPDGAFRQTYDSTEVDASL